jgi:hypothetical protein
VFGCLVKPPVSTGGFFVPALLGELLTFGIILWDAYNS